MMQNTPEIGRLPKDLMIEIHNITVLLSNMPIFGEGKLIAPTVSAAATSITQQRQNNYEFFKYLVNDHDSGQGMNHLETLFEKGKLTRENLSAALNNKLERLYSTVKGFSTKKENDTVPDE